MRHMIFRRSAGLWVLVHDEHPPSKTEWDEYVASVRDADPTRTRSLVFTDGGGPDSMQRDQVNQLLAGRTTQIAVVSDHRTTRGIITALSWFNAGIRAFQPKDWQAAFEYLQISGRQTQAVWDDIRSMKRELGLETRSSRSPVSGLGSEGHRVRELTQY